MRRTAPHSYVVLARPARGTTSYRVVALTGGGFLPVYSRAFRIIAR